MEDESIVIENVNFDGGIDYLLILANSAEIMSESEDSLNEMQKKDDRLLSSTYEGQSHVELCIATAARDFRDSKRQVGDTHVLAHAIAEKCQFWRGKVTRLSEIRRSARNKNKLIVLEESGKYVNGCSQSGSKLGVKLNYKGEREF